MSIMLLHSLVVSLIALGSWAGLGRIPDPPETTPPVETPAVPDKKVEPAPADTQASEKSAARDRVLSSIGRTLRRRAFVPGVDFSNWTDVTQSQLDNLRESNDREFLRSVNRLLGSYKVSHLRLVPPEQRTSPGPAARAQPGTSKPDDDAKAANATLRWIGEDAAILKLRSFDDDMYDRDRIEAMFAEIKPKAKYLVIDLRNNGGGAVTALTHFLSQILPENTAVGVYVNKDMSSRFERAQGRLSTDPTEIASWSDRKFRVRRGAMEPFAGKVAVLINRGSASASEIAAAALRDHGNAALLGQPSSGKVLMSVQANLSEGYKLQLPTSDYITMRGVRLEGNPIRPHVVLPSGRRQPDRAAEEAVSLLSQGL